MKHNATDGCCKRQETKKYGLGSREKVRNISGETRTSRKGKKKFPSGKSKI